MPTVTIAGNTYAVYDTQANAVKYLAASLAPQAVAFIAASTTQQAQALVLATRFFDRQQWQGTPVTPPAIDTQIAWPRTNVIDGNGNAVDSSTVPDPIIKGCFELAAILLARPGLQDQANADPQVASTSSGGTTVNLFRAERIGRFPKVVQELVGVYLASRTYQVGSVASGTDDTNSGDSTNVSSFDDVDRYSLIRGV